MPFNRTEFQPKDRVSQKGYTFLEFGKDDVLKQTKSRVLQKGDIRVNPRPEVDAIIRGVIDANSDLPAAHLVDQITDFCGEELTAALDLSLRNEYIIRRTKLLRKRASESEQLWLYPAIQQHAPRLPDPVPIGDGETVERAKVCYKDLKRYLKILNQRSRDLHEKRIAAVQALMELWPARTKDNRGITLAQVDRQYADGLI
jgi:hypothetical protein